MASRMCRQRNALLLLGIVVGLVWSPRAAAANAVDDWSLIGNQVIIVNAARAGTGNIDFAYLHLAIYDAVNAIDQRYQVFAAKPTSSPVGASPDAATAAAAYVMLKWLFPAQQAYLDGVYAAYLTTIPAGTAKTLGIAIGTEVATAWTTLRTGDGRNAVVPYFFGWGPGVYQVTPGGPPTPGAPWIGQMKTFGIESAVQFRADGPPNLTSAQWAEDFNETKAFGALTGSVRTPEQTEIGLFYVENIGQQINRNIRLIAASHNLSVADAARFYAQVYVTIADAQITTWNGKYFYNFWRPVTAIRAADTDDNPATEPDFAWLPLVVTPGHPEYPEAHSTESGALAYTLAEFFGTKQQNITLTSTSVPGYALREHHFTSTDDMVKEVINGRIYGGMHYRTSGVAGSVIARKVAHYISKNYFQPVE